MEYMSFRKTIQVMTQSVSQSDRERWISTVACVLIRFEQKRNHVLRTELRSPFDALTSEILYTDILLEVPHCIRDCNWILGIKVRHNLRYEFPYRWQISGDHWAAATKRFQYRDASSFVT